MKTSADYLDDIRRATGANSDNQIAIMLGCSRQAVSNYRILQNGFDAPTCLMVAEILGIEPHEILIDMQAQRTRDPAAADVWKEIGRAFSNALPRNPARAKRPRPSRGGQKTISFS